MSNTGWQDEDEVTTTYRSIQLAQVQAEGRGMQEERERILALLELLPKSSNGETVNFVHNLKQLIVSGVNR
jgi:hypothetical protein